MTETMPYPNKLFFYLPLHDGRCKNFTTSKLNEAKYKQRYQSICYFNSSSSCFYLPIWLFHFIQETTNPIELRFFLVLHNHRTQRIKHRRTLSQFPTECKCISYKKIFHNLDNHMTETMPYPNKLFFWLPLQDGRCKNLQPQS